MSLYLRILSLHETRIVMNEWWTKENDVLGSEEINRIFNRSLSSLHYDAITLVWICKTENKRGRYYTIWVLTKTQMELCIYVTYIEFFRGRALMISTWGRGKGFKVEDVKRFICKFRSNLPALTPRKRGAKTAWTTSKPLWHSENCCHFVDLSFNFPFTYKIFVCGASMIVYEVFCEAKSEIEFTVKLWKKHCLRRHIWCVIFAM